MRIDNYNATHHDSFGVEQIPKEMNTFIGNKNINIYRMQPYDSIICGYICIGFIDFMSKAKSLLNYTNLFSPDDYEN